MSGCVVGRIQLWPDPEGRLRRIHGQAPLIIFLFRRSVGVDRHSRIGWGGCVRIADGGFCLPVSLGEILLYV